LHVEGFSAVGTFKDETVTFNDGALWQKLGSMIKKGMYKESREALITSMLQQNKREYLVHKLAGVIEQTEEDFMFSGESTEDVQAGSRQVRPVLEAELRKAEEQENGKKGEILVEKTDEAKESKAVVESDAKVEELIKMCNWDCYLQRYPGLKSKTWEAEHPKKGLEYAKTHYIKNGHAAGRNCQCDADMLAVKMVQHSQDAAEVEAQLAEQTDLLAEAAAEAELIKDCDWGCYLQRYPKLRNEKWEQERGNHDYARKHFLQFGRHNGKNCKCDATFN